MSLVEGFGGQVVMTSDAHERASDRVAEVAERSETEILVMVRGDEPLITPDMASLALEPFSRPAVQCVNLIREITSPEEFANPNVIKIVRDRLGKALYYSRQPIRRAGCAGLEAGMRHSVPTGGGAPLRRIATHSW